MRLEVLAGDVVVEDSVGDEGVHRAVRPQLEQQRQQLVAYDLRLVAGGPPERPDQRQPACLVDDPGLAPSQDRVVVSVALVDGEVDEVHTGAAQQREVHAAARVDLLDRRSKPSAVDDPDMRDPGVAQRAIVILDRSELADQGDVRRDRDERVVAWFGAAAAERDDASVHRVLGEVIAEGEVVRPDGAEGAGVHGGEGGTQVAAAGGGGDLAQHGDGGAEIADRAASLRRERVAAKNGGDRGLAEGGGERGAGAQAVGVRCAAAGLQARDRFGDGGVEGQELLEALLGARSKLRWAVARGALGLLGEQQLQGARQLACARAAPRRAHPRSLDLAVAQRAPGAGAG